MAIVPKWCNEVIAKGISHIPKNAELLRVTKARQPLAKPRLSENPGVMNFARIASCDIQKLLVVTHSLQSQRWVAVPVYVCKAHLVSRALDTCVRAINTSNRIGHSRHLQ